MGFFKKTYGTFSLEFISKDNVRISNSIPDPSQRLPVTLAFPFMLTAKLLYNFPPPSGTRILEHGYKRVFELTDGKKLKELDESFSSFLGIFCDNQIEIVNHRDNAICVYSASMFEKGGGYGIELSIPHGDEEYYHAASIDAVWEYYSKKWDVGSILIAFYEEFLKQLIQVGVEDINTTYSLSLQTAVKMSSVVAGIFT